DDENILLLEQQDRKLWDRELIDSGISFLEKSLSDGEISWYHLQAAIAYQHVVASSFDATDWNAILLLYNILQQNFPSPVTFLNRAIAFSKVHGATAAIELILSSTEKEKLKKYYLLPATLGELFLKEKNFSVAKKHFEEAIALTNSAAEKKLLSRKIEKCIQ
ncbi:MAG: hypothetical protein LH473_03595, partial [Chitinophagales bacterium]|nr:hypothetical protein [Chitinophagales bacterium]